MTRAGSARLWWALLAAAGVLAVVLVVASGTVLVLLVGSRDDPHGYAVLFSVLALAFLVPPTILAVLGVVGLLRRRRHGYSCAGAAYALVTLTAVLLLGMNAASPGADGMSAWELVVPVLVAVLGVAATVVAVLGAREVAR